MREDLVLAGRGGGWWGGVIKYIILYLQYL